MNVKLEPYYKEHGMKWYAWSYLFHIVERKDGKCLLYTREDDDSFLWTGKYYNTLEDVVKEFSK